MDSRPPSRPSVGEDYDPAVDDTNIEEDYVDADLTDDNPLAERLDLVALVLVIVGLVLEAATKGWSWEWLGGQ